MEAYKAGDWDRFAQARTAAEASLDDILAQSSEDDPCSGDILAVGLRAMELAGTEALDARPVMSMPEEARFVFAVNQIGQGPRAEPHPALQAYDDCTRQDFNRAAVRDPGAARATRAAALKSTQALAAWRDELRAEHGEEFEPRMRAAVSALRQNGFSDMRWPAQIVEVAAARS